MRPGPAGRFSRSAPSSPCFSSRTSPPFFTFGGAPADRAAALPRGAGLPASPAPQRGALMVRRANLVLPMLLLLAPRAARGLRPFAARPLRARAGRGGPALARCSRRFGGTDAVDADPSIFKLPRFLFAAEEHLVVNRDIELSEEQTQKAMNVLRLRTGSQLRLFDGRGREFLCEVVGLPGGRRSKKGETAAQLEKEEHSRAGDQKRRRPRRKGRAAGGCVVRPVELLRGSGSDTFRPWEEPSGHGGAAADLPVHLLFAPLKRERTRVLVEKATELGVASIEPVATARTEKHALAALNTQALESGDMAFLAEQMGSTSGALPLGGGEEGGEGGGDGADVERMLEELDEAFIRRNGRLLEWAVASAEQSERLHVPLVRPRPPLDLGRLLAAWESERPGCALLAAVERGGLFVADALDGAEGDGPVELTEPMPVLEALGALFDAREELRSGVTGVAVLVGPEGGFTADEAMALLAHPSPYVLPVSLGSNVLRSDTASAAMLAVTQAFLQGRGGARA